MSEEAATVLATAVAVPPPVSTAQRSVLYAVRRRGEATAADVAGQLDMTVSGARQHLTGLTDVGLLEVADAPRAAGQQGRTERVYRIAPPAEALFPRAYGELTNQLLNYLPSDAVTAAFERRRDARIEAARTRLERRRSFAAKVDELARILDEDGYMATVERQPDGTTRIVERNCAIFAVAREHPTSCSTELEFLRAALPEADIDRVTHMMAGASSCSYEVKPSRRRRGVRGV
jgi:predicted ArsR family transcriptional regulator